MIPRSSALSKHNGPHKSVLWKSFGAGVAVCLGLISSTSAMAQIKATGEFVAENVCEATKKLETDNPGSIRTETGTVYKLAGFNRQPATHYLIEVPSAPLTKMRWVAVGCGRVDNLVVDASSGSAGNFRLVTVSGNFYVKKTCPALKRTDATSDGTSVSAGDTYGLIARNENGSFFQVRIPEISKRKNRWLKASCGTARVTYDEEAGVAIQPDTIEHTLAASWQPGFCATSAGQGNTGCDSIVSDELATKQFSLHGLWPDDLNTLAIFPCNCHLPKGPTSCFKNPKNKELVDLNPKLSSRLDAAMPGSRGDLENHEWTKHGTCYERYETGATSGSDDDEYFEDSLLVLDQLNASAVQQLFEANIGKTLKAEEVFQAFDNAFGAGAGDRVQIVCRSAHSDGRLVIQELYIGLGGSIEPGADLGALILAAPPRSEATSEEPCRRGEVVAWQ